MRILVCGSRTWTDKKRIKEELKQCPSGTIIINGGARGADSLATQVARDLSIGVITYPADWSKGLAAGIIRNREMLILGKPDMVIAFRMGGTSRGTDDMISIAQQAGLKVRVIYEGK